MDIADLKNYDGYEAPLYQQYPGQFDPEPAYLLLDEDGVVEVDWLPRGQTPMDMYHRRRLSWSLPSAIRADRLLALLADETLRGLLDVVRAGHTVEWDGSNHRGCLTPEAEEAEEQIERLLERNLDPTDVAAVWDAADWLDWLDLSVCWRDDCVEIADVGRIYTTTTDEELEDLEEEINAAAHQEEVVLLDVAEHLEQLREDLRERVAA